MLRTTPAMSRSPMASQSAERTLTDGNTAEINGGGLHASGAGERHHRSTAVRVPKQRRGIKKVAVLWNGADGSDDDQWHRRDHCRTLPDSGVTMRATIKVAAACSTLAEHWTSICGDAIISSNLATDNNGNGGGVMTVGGTVTIDDSSISRNQRRGACGRRNLENNNGSVTITLTGVRRWWTQLPADGNNAGINGGGLARQRCGQRHDRQRWNLPVQCRGIKKVVDLWNGDGVMND